MSQTDTTRLRKHLCCARIEYKRSCRPKKPAGRKIQRDVKMRSQLVEMHSQVVKVRQTGHPKTTSRVAIGVGGVPCLWPQWLVGPCACCQLGVVFTDGTPLKLIGFPKQESAVGTHRCVVDFMDKINIGACYFFTPPWNIPLPPCEGTKL